MTRNPKLTSLINVMDEIVHPVGYQRLGGLFWKRSEELTQLVHLQKSRWGGGVYVNIGVTPTQMITKATPPGTGYWALELRPTSWKGRYFQTFCRLEDDEPVDAEEVERALQWLVKWMEKRLRAESVRQDVLDQTSWIWELGIATRMIKDWAGGSLRAPEQYFPEQTRYYG